MQDLEKKGLSMNQIMNYVKPELLIVSIVLYFIGMALKKAGIVKDKYILLILGGIGIVVCGIYVFGTCTCTGVREAVMAVFTAITQGILVAGLSTYVNQMIKQMRKEE